MGLYINNTGKLLGAAVVASAVTQAATGKDTGLAKGCLTGLVVWFSWVVFVFMAIYYIIFK